MHEDLTDRSIFETECHLRWEFLNYSWIATNPAAECQATMDNTTLPLLLLMYQQIKKNLNVSFGVNFLIDHLLSNDLKVYSLGLKGI